MARRVVAAKAPATPFISDTKLLGQLVRAKRTANRMKLEDCAALCGVGINTLSRIENGNPNCTLGATFAVLKALGIHLAAPADLLSAADDSSTADWV